MLTHAEIKAKALSKAEARAEYERLNREEFAILEECWLQGMQQA